MGKMNKLEKYLFLIFIGATASSIGVISYLAVRITRICLQILGLA